MPKTSQEPAARGLDALSGDPACARVDLPVRLALNAVMPCLPAFPAARPRLTVELSCTDRRVDLVAEGFDCVLRVGAVHAPLLLARPLGQMAMVNVASPAYLAARGQPATPDELLTQGHHLVDYSQTCADRRPLARFDAAPLLVRLMMSPRRHTPQRGRMFMDWLAEQIAPALRNDNPPP